MTTLKIISFIVATLLFILLCILLSITFHHFVWFNWKSCKHCGHILEYEGLKEDKAGNYYVFYCPKCKKWELIPKEEFFKDISKGLSNVDKTHL